MADMSRSNLEPNAQCMADNIRSMRIALQTTKPNDTNTQRQ